MNIDIDFLPKSREYLLKFVNGNYEQFAMDTQELQPRNGYGFFPNSSKIVNCMRSITLNFEDVFSDLSIPEKFTTPTDLITHAKNFIDILESFEKYFDEAVTIIRGNNPTAIIPDPVWQINKHRKKTVDAFKMFVQLAEKERGTEGQISFVTSMTPIEKLQTLFDGFHDLAIQITHRRNEGGTSRPTLKISDEYDVQDLLHGLLKIFFKDIRAEEYAPSSGGSSKRTDFLLKEEQIFVEVKKTRTGLKQKEIGDQLSIDIQHYRTHPDCKSLVCFVYDPESHIINPNGLIRDLSSVGDVFSVYIFIKP